MPGKQAGEHGARSRTGDAHGEITAERDAGDQHHHPPDLIGIERQPGTVSLIRQDRQQHHRDEQQLDAGAQFLAAQGAQPAVQNRLEAQQQGRDHGRRGAFHHIAQPHHGAERESQQAGDRTGDAHLGGTLHIHHVRRGQRHDNTEEGETQQQAAQLLRQQPHHTTQQAEQAVGSDSRNPRALRRFALFPAAFHANQETDRKRRCQEKDRMLCHGRATATGMSWQSRRQPERRVAGPGGVAMIYTSIFLSMR